MCSVRTLLLACLLVACAFLASCCCCPEEQDPGQGAGCPAGAVAGTDLEVQARARAYFLDDDGGSAVRQVAELRVDGTWKPLVHVSKVELVAVHVFAAPGSTSAADLARCERLVYGVPAPGMRWSSPRIEGGWDGSTAAYRVLVRTVYRWKENGELRYVDRVLQNTSAITPSKGIPIVPAQGDPGDDQDTPTLYASGTFDGLQGVALYNIDLSYNDTVDWIRVYARPASDTTALPNAAFLIHTEDDPPAPPRGWHPTAISGPYNGSDQYVLCVEVQYASGGAPDVLRGTFSGIGGSGNPVLLE